jgi:cytochrome c oxidase accessory protein FixG
VKDMVAAIVILVLALGPFLPWSRPGVAPQRALLFDFAGGHAYVFGAVFGPRDLPLLLAALIGAALLLFLTNSLAGRIWCGFACPQTIWTDLYRRLENRVRAVGGPGLARALWLLVSFLTGFAIVSWFFEGGGLFGPPAPLATALLLLFTALTYLLAAHAQELVCTHMCPWPRIQAAMVDGDTALVTYDEPRGEPRGPLKRSARSAGAQGACVDCGLCVAVCPMGIDIRRGQQLACIGCGLCADACDGVMARTGKPAGLVRFASQRAFGQPGTPAPPVWRRPRPMAYALLIGLVMTGTLLLFQGRDSVSLTIEPVRSRGYVLLSDGAIRNDFTLLIRDDRAAGGPLVASLSGLPGAAAQLGVGGAAPSADLVLPPRQGDAPIEARLLLTVPADAVPTARTPFELRLTPLGSAEPIAVAGSYFKAPAGGQP